MSTYMYIPANTSAANRTELNSFAHSNKMSSPEVLSSLSDFSRLTAGDQVIVYDALSIADSHTEVIQFLQDCLAKSVRTHFAKYNLSFNAQAQSNLSDLIQLSRRIEADYVSRRNQETMTRRREYGIVLGRPKGRKNKSLKLDKYKKEIQRYLELSISKASIAKLVDCHPQTLYDWIERNDDLDTDSSGDENEKEFA